MKARETLYYAISNTIGKFIQCRTILKFLSIFSFPGRGESLIEPGIGKWLKNKGVIVYIITISLLFGVNAIWSTASGRLLSDSLPETRNFFEDWPNILNYLFICPLYVTFGICFLVHISDLRSSLIKTSLATTLDIPDFKNKPSIFNYVAIGIVLFFSTLSISFYAAELSKYDYLFWFQTVTNSGEKIFSPMGIFI